MRLKPEQEEQMSASGTQSGEICHSSDEECTLAFASFGQMQEFLGLLPVLTAEIVKIASSCQKNKGASESAYLTFDILEIQE
jgi:hypothetical protein